MSAAKRCAWGLLFLGWAAVIVVPDVWDVDRRWLGDLCDAGAVLALPVAILMLHSGKEGVSRVRDWRHAGKIRALEAQVESNRAEIRSLKEQLGGLNQALVLSHAAAGRHAPPEVTANAPTQPILWKVVG